MKNLKSIQNLIPIEQIYEQGIIKLKKQKYIKIIKINPINFNLKSNLEKEAILNSYKNFLKSCDFDIQIFIQSKKVDLNSHFSKIKNNLKPEKNNLLIEYSEKYFIFINKLNNEKKSSSKNIFIIIKNKENYQEQNLSKEIIIEDLNNKYFKIKELLAKCGNKVEELNKKESLEILFLLLNKERSV
ncbi:MAG: hypothetical protein IJV31_05850 [Clostridia bacterium]|nr:hypothetical protein [Clostridia bacterium]